MAKRFMTYNTEDAMPHRQLVTNGNGEWVAEKRLAWKEGEKVSITWNGNTEGLVVSSDFPMYKVSDQMPSNDDIAAGTVTFSVNGNVRTENISDVWDTMVEIGAVTDKLTVVDPDYKPFVAIVREAGAAYNGITFPETGIYFVSHEDVVEQTTATEFVWGKQTIHKIPSEYLPVSRIVFTYDGNNYACNVPFEQFEDAVKNGLPISYVDESETLTAYHSVTARRLGMSVSEITVFDGMEVVVTFAYTPNGIKLPS